MLRAKPDDKKTGSTHVALAWRQLGDLRRKRVEFDPTAAAGVPAGMRTVSFRRPSWSEDGKVIFVGLAKWEDKPPTPSRGRGAGSSQANTTSEGATPPAGGEGSTTPQRPAGGSGAAAEADEAAAVDIWHWNDVDVMAKQKLTATADRRRTCPPGTWTRTGSCSSARPLPSRWPRRLDQTSRSSRSGPPTRWIDRLAAWLTSSSSI